MQTRKTFSWIKEEIIRFISVSLIIYIITRAPISNAYPIFAQQSYENPREATGRIVCANCHLANKPVDIKVPQAVKGKKKNGVVFKSGFLERINKLDPYFELFHATNKLEHSRNPLDRRIHIFYNPHSPLFLEQKQFA